MQIERTKLDGVVIVTPRRFPDPRGYFSESWNKRQMVELGLDHDCVQDNHSMSHQPCTLRGLHYQRPPHAQTKLVRCGRGVLFDVAVDIRNGSPTYGQWVGVELSEQNGRQLFIPAGFLHGFVTRTPNTEVIYKCSNYYAPECDGAIRYDCPFIGIDWGLGETAPALSEKDAAAPTLSGFDSPFVYEAAQ